MAQPPARRPFGSAADGQAVEAVTLTAPNGLSATILTLGATLQAFHTHDRDGVLADIVLGHDTVEPYRDQPTYLGVAVGRYANRIAHGRFSLDGQAFALQCNDGDHHLHGGDGFDRRSWDVLAYEPTSSVTLGLTSEDGDGGYPGRVEATCRYDLDDDGLTITFEATTDRPTVVNLTNHAYFNLAGPGSGRSALDARLTVMAERFTPVDTGLIPTGEPRPVAGTPFDFREPRRIADRVRDASDAQIRLGRGYDHNFVLNGARGEMKTAARLEDDLTGRRLDVLTTEAGLQLYSGNFLDGTLVGKGGRLIRQGDGVCLEPQAFPDSPNRPEFPSTRLDPGQVYRHILAFRPSTF